MAGFNRFGGGGFSSLYPSLGGLGQNNVSRRDDRFDDRGRNGRGFERRDIDRDFGRRDPSPRRRRFSPDVSSSDTQSFDDLKLWIASSFSVNMFDLRTCSPGVTEFSLFSLDTEICNHNEKYLNDILVE